MRVGDVVLVEPPEHYWWVGQVIRREGGDNGNSFFQIVCVDTGVNPAVNSNGVTGVSSLPRLTPDKQPDPGSGPLRC